MSDPILIALTKEEAIRLQDAFVGDIDLVVMRCCHSQHRSALLAHVCSEPEGVEPIDATFAPALLPGAELTLDMAETILRHFDVAQTQGYALVEHTTRGLWFACPHGIRLFIGLARLLQPLPKQEVVKVATGAVSV